MADQLPHEAQYLYYLPKPNETIAVNDWDCVLGLDPSRHKEVTLPLLDCRRHEQDFTFDREGFCFRTLDVEEDITVNEAAYVGQVEELLKTEFPTASEFLFFPIMIRSEPRPQGKDKATYFSAISSMTPGRHPPIGNTHVDWTPNGIAGVYEGNVNKEVGIRIRESGKRLVGVSVWRPLEQVKRDPLAVLKATSLDTNEECRIVPRTSANGTPYENRVVAYSDNVKNHEWCWLSHQMPNEITLIKLADTQPPPGVAECCPHTSLNIGNDFSPPRQSCELRCVIVY